MEDMYVCYHYFIGTDGTTVALRNNDERTGCTMNDEYNFSSLHVALAGNFNNALPNSRQLSSLKKLLININSIYPLEEIIPHRKASSSQCAGSYLNEWVNKIDLTKRDPPKKKFVLSRYYTPVRGQPYYYRNYEGWQLFTKAVDHNVIVFRDGKFIYDGQIMPVVLGTAEQATAKMNSNDPLKYIIKSETEYRAEFQVNCLGDCLSTASTYRLTPKDAYRVVACPANYPFRTKFIINGSTYTCWDRGGAITEEGNTVRLDIWSGQGKKGLDRIKSTPVPENPTVEVIRPPD